jgi:hypothetical protein
LADIDPETMQGPHFTVVSKQEVVLGSGRPAFRYEIDSLGRSLSLHTEINGRAVVLSCWGDPAPFDAIAVTLGAADGNQTEAQAPDLRAEIDLPASLDSGVNVPALFTLTNASADGVYVLKWFTPLEGMAGDIFRVEREGAALPYRGKLVKRGPPIPEDYVWLEAGQSVAAEVDLAEGYDFSQAGQYTVEFRSPQISHVAFAASEQADAFEQLGRVHMPSEAVTVVVEHASDSQ